MSELKHICFVVPNYPTPNDPVYTFVRELVCSIADLGYLCSVIAPQSITNYIFKKKRKRPFYWQDITKKNNKINIYQPIHAPFTDFKFFKWNISGMLTLWSVENAFKKMKIKPDILYAHFWHSGVIAGKLGRENNIPVFVASGESEIWVKNLYNEKQIQENLANIKGVICVSNKNKQESLELNLTTEKKTIVVPNAVNNEQFYKINQRQAREKLGFKEGDFIVAFTGSFSHRKGVLRLSDAIGKLTNVKCIYIGSGELRPNTDNALFIGRVPHHQIVNYLNAADVFVLPTLAEGCSNAIIEAMACGLPIISSDLSFNDDILTKKNSLRVDSEDISAISAAIKILRDNPLKRRDMSRESLELAKNLNLEARAKRITEFIHLMKG